MSCRLFAGGQRDARCKGAVGVFTGFARSEAFDSDLGEFHRGQIEVRRDRAARARAGVFEAEAFDAGLRE